MAVPTNNVMISPAPVLGSAVVFDTAEAAAGFSALGVTGGGVGAAGAAMNSAVVVHAGLVLDTS